MRVVHGLRDAVTCRILMPGYSEIYQVDDLIGDNTSSALSFRIDILNLHRPDDASLEALLERLDNCDSMNTPTPR